MTYKRLDEQPKQVDLYCDDDLFCKLLGPMKAGTFVPQHAHEYQHATLLLIGAVDLKVNEGPWVRYFAPTTLTIRAGDKHLFKALINGTMLACVHNLHGMGYPAVREENHIV